ncbi:AlbA family DNA-binding domain-containing protein [Jeotgalibacillus haloalkalitolerans]|uniref:ATP-binding protein n=1 Tax=Jeotgalibacillus haloalkalitolerans TaxID=3104292 RepID=A0ABU5KMX0_9BACL|nr:ATP-binding protein [Jeotgalibacillus sp. HH7-29]MDZ5712611.1 ATP-binding protein [Jeotgalibacillus sp. HH7-29]
MANLDTLIKYEREGTKLDFKKEQYRKEKYQDLIKDIMAMANAPIDGERHIVIGVKDKPDGTKEYFSLDRGEIVDQATFQQVIRENVEPSIEFSYYTHEIEDKVFGIIEISHCNNPPYMMRKDFRGLKKGECFVRKGSQQERMTRRDLDEILKHKDKIQFDRNIWVGFNSSLKNEISVNVVEKIDLPSENARSQIEKIIADRKTKSSEVNQLSILGKVGVGYTNFFGNAPYEQRSTEELVKNLENIEETYYEDDLYYIGEELSEKINLTIRNEGNQYLEDVSIVLTILSHNIWVMDRIHQEPNNDLWPRPDVDLDSLYYPNVTEINKGFKVTAELGQLRHKLDTLAFNEDLRVFFPRDSKGEIIEIEYTLYAKNLPTPINGFLKIIVK